MGRSIALLLCLMLGLTAAASLSAQAPVESGKTERDFSSPRWIADRGAWRALPIRERHAERKRVEKLTLALTKNAVQKPWRARQGKWFLVISNADRKTVAAATTAAERVFGWCDTQFQGVSDEYVRRRVLSVAFVEDKKDATSHFGGGPWRGLTLDVDRVLELHMHKGSVHRETMYRRLFRDILDVYLMDKDPLLYRYQPGWLAEGLAECVGTASLKNKKLMFEPSDRERDGMRDVSRSGKARTLRQILTINEAAVTSALAGNQRFEFAHAVRFFLFGPGQTMKFSQGFLPAYMKAVIDAVEELRPDWSPLPATGAVEAGGRGIKKIAPGARQKWEPRRDAVSTLAFKSACGSWTDSQWGKIEKAFAGYQSR